MCPGIRMKQIKIRFKRSDFPIKEGPGACANRPGVWPTNKESTW